ncbi:MAG: MMPL family transporter, partial [Actinomycetales bacterium]
MPGLSAWAVRRPVTALVAWFVLVLAVIGLGSTVGGKLNDSFDLPDTESTAALSLLEQAGRSGGLQDGATVVWSPASGSTTDSSVLSGVLPLLEEISALPSVACVTNPSGVSFGSGCPKPPVMPTQEELAQMPAEMVQAMAAAAKATSPVSADGTVAYASVTFREGGAANADAVAILDAVTSLNSVSLAVGASGSALEAAGQEPPSSEAIGLAVAIVILLIAFGSIIAAGMPIVVALVGLATGQMAVLIVARFFDVATFAPTLAAMIGLGVGIDYALFVMNRYRQAVLAGHAPKAAAMEA